jgi:hypothetical protein
LVSYWASRIARYRRISKGALRDFKTGTGFAGAKLSEILPAARDARFVRMTECALAPLPARLRSRCSLRQDDEMLPEVRSSVPFPLTPAPR